MQNKPCPVCGAFKLKGKLSWSDEFEYCCMCGFGYKENMSQSEKQKHFEECRKQFELDIE